LLQELLKKSSSDGPDSAKRSNGTSHASVQPKVSDALESVTPYGTNSSRKRTITDAITLFLTRDMMPIRTVAKPGFINLLKTLDPRYEVPGRNYFSQTAIPALYDEIRAEVQLKLEQIQYFSATSDLWSSRTSEPYMSLSVHFIDEEWALRSYCLETVYFPEDHTAEEIGEGLKEAFESWGLKVKQLTCMTTDSGSNIKKALETVNEWPRLPCFGHILHNAIGEL
jgi:hypothetical protein